MSRVVLRWLAVADIDDAVAWYDAEEAGLSDRVVDELKAAVERIGERPRQFPDVG